MSAPRPTSSDGQLTGSLPEFLAFQWFVTPWVIQVIFWLMVVSVVGGALFWGISGLVLVFNGVVVPGLMMMLGALAGFVFGLIFARVYCELIILAFKLYDRLGEISRKLER